MAAGWRRASPGAPAASVESLEGRLGARLPSDYRTFLLTHDGGEPEDNAFSIPGTDNESGVNDFLGVADIMDELKRADDALPPDHIPVAYAEGGNLVLLHVTDGRVFFWDHELESTIELADSFDVFQEELRPFDISEVKLKPGQVKSAWIDPDLLA